MTTPQDAGNIEAIIGLRRFYRISVMIDGQKSE
jgi:hypothetical protein